MLLQFTVKNVEILKQVKIRYFSCFMGNHGQRKRDEEKTRERKKNESKFYSRHLLYESCGFSYPCLWYAKIKTKEKLFLFITLLLHCEYFGSIYFIHRQKLQIDRNFHEILTKKHSVITMLLLLPVPSLDIGAHSHSGQLHRDW